MADKKYDANSISILEGLEAVRKRPGMYIGSVGTKGLNHLIYEIADNSVDEHLAGYCTEIKVTLNDDGTATIEDNGRGIPVGFNKNENRMNWELLFCEMYAGGKYNNNEGESYEFSLGLNGLGLCSTQYASEYMDVEIKRDGYKYSLHFEKGENIGGLKKEE